MRVALKGEHPLLSLSDLLLLVGDLRLSIVDVLIGLVDVSLSGLNALLVAVLLCDLVEVLGVTEFLLLLRQGGIEVLDRLLGVRDGLAGVLDLLPHRVELRVVVVLRRPRLPPLLHALLHLGGKARQEVLEELGGRLLLLLRLGGAPGRRGGPGRVGPRRVRPGRGGPARSVRTGCVTAAAATSASAPMGLARRRLVTTHSGLERSFRVARALTLLGELAADLTDSSTSLGAGEHRFGERQALDDLPDNGVGLDLHVLQIDLESVVVDPRAIDVLGDDLPENAHILVGDTQHLLEVGERRRAVDVRARDRLVEDVVDI